MSALAVRVVAPPHRDQSRGWRGAGRAPLPRSDLRPRRPALCSGSAEIVVVAVETHINESALFTPAPRPQFKHWLVCTATRGMTFRAQEHRSLLLGRGDDRHSRQHHFTASVKKPVPIPENRAGEA